MWVGQGGASRAHGLMGPEWNSMNVIIGATEVYLHSVNYRVKLPSPGHQKRLGENLQNLAGPPRSGQHDPEKADPARESRRMTLDES